MTADVVYLLFKNQSNKGQQGLMSLKKTGKVIHD